MAESTGRVKELRQALATKVAELDEIAQGIKIGADETGDANGVYVPAEVAEKFRATASEADEIKKALQIEESRGALHQYLDAPVDEATAVKAAAAAQAGRGMVRKSLGEMFVDSDEYKGFRKAGGYTMPQAFELEGVDIGSMWVGLGQQRKDVYTALPADTNFPFGFGPVQIDPVVPLQTRTVRVRDLFPIQRTDAAVIEFFRVTGFTNAASVVPERSGGNYAEKPHTNLEFVGTTAPVRTIAHWETVHRNALDDVAQLRSTIDNELLYGLRLAEDDQILNGTGTGEDLLGILNTPDIQEHTQADVAGDNKADAVRRAMTKVFLSYFEPTGVVLHPEDWEDMELLKTTAGAYILATNVAVGAVQQIWRLPVVSSPAIDSGTGLVGSFGIGATLYDRMTANVRIAEQHADLFIRNAVLVLAEERLALATKRPESFAKVNFT